MCLSVWTFFFVLSKDYGYPVCDQLLWFFGHGMSLDQRSGVHHRHCEIGKRSSLVSLWFCFLRMSLWMSYKRYSRATSHATWSTRAVWSTETAESPTPCPSSTSRRGTLRCRSRSCMQAPSWRCSRRLIWRGCMKWGSWRSSLMIGWEAACPSKSRCEAPGFITSAVLKGGFLKTFRVFISYT